MHDECRKSYSRLPLVKTFHVTFVLCLMLLDHLAIPHAACSMDNLQYTGDMKAWIDWRLQLPRFLFRLEFLQHHDSPQHLPNYYRDVQY